MDTTVKTVVTFKSSAFNSSEPKPYFVNPGCFGDDVVKWLAEQFRTRGYHTGDVLGQEDFGWYVTVLICRIEHCCVIGYRPGSGGGQGAWIGWLERRRGAVASLFGRRTHGIDPAAPWVLHDILSSSPLVEDVQWHLRRDFDTGRQRNGTENPSADT